MTAQQIVDLLNELHGLDPEFLQPLIETRVPCNEAVANHPTVTVDDPGPGKFTVGLLGILEGVVGIDGRIIGMVVDDDTKKCTGFRLLEPAEHRRDPVAYVPPLSRSRP
jgi:hypothetical protein